VAKEQVDKTALPQNFASIIVGKKNFSIAFLFLNRSKMEKAFYVIKTFDD
jgi:hypothetical protein